ncbi:serum paraoxonase/arylesterase 2-like isoform X2 [Convolutriloba macropyga]|uniref:serum paraoxonase/arylesterase 2-like isoform X2 n=1 Tax=Convolutriloba macropyga TaxID=536237 RepID=UPI003F51AD65
MELVRGRHPVAFISVSLLILLVAERTYNYMDKYGVLRTVEVVHPGTCKVLEGDYHGSEDLTLGPDGSVIASTGGLNLLQRTANFYKGDKLIKITGTKIEELQFENFKYDFVPHGIDLMEVDKENWLLFAINHRPDQDYVEMFDWNTAGNNLKIKHYKSASVAQLGITGTINDVTITSRTSFYVTNDKFYNSRVDQIAKYLGLPFTKLVHYNNGNATDVSRGYVEANGVAILKSARKIFLADPFSNTFYEFEVDQIDGSLKLVSSLIVPTSPDNINIVSENEVLIGCHVKLHDFLVYTKDIDHLNAPSHVIRVFRKDIKSEWEYETVFMDDGSIVSGSSVAVYSNDVLYIGTVADKIAYCVK